MNSRFQKFFHVRSMESRSYNCDKLEEQIYNIPDHLNDQVMLQPGVHEFLMETGEQNMEQSLAGNRDKQLTVIYHKKLGLDPSSGILKERIYSNIPEQEQFPGWAPSGGDISLISSVESTVQPTLSIVEVVVSTVSPEVIGGVTSSVSQFTSIILPLFGFNYMHNF